VGDTKEIGKITHFFDKIMVAAIKLSGDLRIGDTITIKGETTNFEQPIESIQINRVDVENAGPGDEIGIKVNYKVRSNDAIYLKT